MRPAALCVVGLILCAAPVAAQSPDCTTIPPASAITDSQLHVWTIVGGSVQQDGVPRAYADALSWTAGSLYKSLIASGQVTVQQWTGDTSVNFGWRDVPQVPVCAPPVVIPTVTNGTKLAWDLVPPDVTHGAPSDVQLCIDGGCLSLGVVSQTTLPVMADGPHKLTIRTVNATGQADSDVLAVIYAAAIVVGFPPSAAVNLRLP